MLEMAGVGSKVLALRSVEFARNHNVPIHVRSSFTWEPGTWVTSQEPSVEDPVISGVVTDVSEAKVTVRSVPDRPGVSASLFEPLAQAPGVNSCRSHVRGHAQSQNPPQATSAATRIDTILPGARGGSPLGRAWTASMPLVTLPHTVYWRSRKVASSMQMKNWLLAECG